MEDGLVLNGGEKEARMVPCLNPCCSGRWSRTINDYEYPYNHINVLILVVVEDDLVLTFGGGGHVLIAGS